MSVLIFILILSFLVIVHELGHFFAAKWAKMEVEEFGVGYPPRALKLFTWKRTLFSLNWIPFGGFVSIKGEADEKGDFYTFPAFKRLVVILAGAVVNFIVGVIAFAIVFSIVGIPSELNQPRIGKVVPDSPAAKAELPESVNIIALEADGERVSTPDVQSVIEQIKAHSGEEVRLVTSGECNQLDCQEMAQEFDVYLRTPEETPEGEGSLGIIFQGVVYLDYPWYEVPFRGVWYGLQQAWWLGGLILQALGDLGVQLITLGKVPTEIAGPVGIVHQASSQGIFTEGWLAIISFTGMLSVNLAIMNILPIPALDGGRAVFIVFEKILGRKKIEKVEHYANYFGYSFLLGLIIIVSIRDIWRLFD